MSTLIQHRYVTCLQRRGNLGKSTLIAALAQWLDQRGVMWRGFDLDTDHRSFSRLFRDSAVLRELGNEPETEVIKIARASIEAPVTLVDPRAHIADVVLRGWDMIRFPETLAAAGGRITALLFPGDDLEILTDIDALVTQLGAGVDYVIVRNPARQPKTRMFDGSALEEDLVRLGAAVLEMPALLAWARNHLSALETELGRGVSHVEVVANRELPIDGMVRLIIEDWVRVLFRRFDQIADKLLPSADAAKIASVDTAAVGSAPRITRGAKINKTNL